MSTCYTYNPFQPVLDVLTHRNFSAKHDFFYGDAVRQDMCWTGLVYAMTDAFERTAVLFGRFTNDIRELSRFHRR